MGENRDVLRGIWAELILMNDLRYAENVLAFGGELFGRVLSECQDVRQEARDRARRWAAGEEVVSAS